MSDNPPPYMPPNVSLWTKDFDHIGWVDRDGVLHVDKKVEAVRRDPALKALEALHVIARTVDRFTDDENAPA